MIGYNSESMLSLLSSVSSSGRISCVLPTKTMEFTPVDVSGDDGLHDVTLGGMCSTKVVRVYHGSGVCRSQYEGYMLYQFLCGQRVWVVMGGYMIYDFGTKREFFEQDFHRYRECKSSLPSSGFILINYKQFDNDVTALLSGSDTVVFVNCPAISVPKVYRVIEGCQEFDMPRFAMFYTYSVPSDTVSCRIYDHNLHFDTLMWRSVVSDIDGALGSSSFSVDVLVHCGSSVAKAINYFDKYVYNRSVKKITSYRIGCSVEPLLNDCVTYATGAKYSDVKVLVYVHKVGSDVLIKTYSYDLDSVVPSYYRSSLVSDRAFLSKAVTLGLAAGGGFKGPVGCDDDVPWVDYTKLDKVVGSFGLPFALSQLERPSDIPDLVKEELSPDSGSQGVSDLDTNVNSQLSLCSECGLDAAGHEANSYCSVVEIADKLSSHITVSSYSGGGVSKEICAVFDDEGKLSVAFDCLCNVHETQGKDCFYSINDDVYDK